MIGRLRGIVDGRGEGWVLLDVGGVGYMVEGSTRMIAELPHDGETVTLAIETYVREDQLRLFGFGDETQRSWFRLLMSVQGVGAKVALAILATLNIQDLTQAVAAQDKAMIARAPGVGPKVAQRIVQELKDKVPGADFVVSKTADTHAAYKDAASALLNLGYQQAQIHSALTKIQAQMGEDAEVGAIIRAGLKELGR